MPLTLLNQDITRMSTDAIVNAANVDLAMGGGVCGAIFHAAGAAELQAACDPLAPISTGEAVITPGFRLPARYVIHTAGPVYRRIHADHCREQLQDIHGRCLVEIDKVHLECQIYRAFSGEKEIERVEDIRRFIGEVNAKNRGAHARMIPLIPAMLNGDYVKTNFASFMQTPYTVVLGLDYGSVSPAAVQLNGLGAMGLSGKEGSGRHNFIRYLVQMLDTMYPGQTEVTIIDSLGKRLSALKNARNVVSYEFLADRAVDAVNSIEQRLAARYQALATGTEEPDNKLLLLILNSRDAVDAINNNAAAMNAYRNMIGKYRSMNVFVLVGDFENANVPYGAPEIYKKIKEAKQIIFFDDMSNLKILDMPLAILRQFKKPVETGDCYYIRDNECYKVKTPISSQA